MPTSVADPDGSGWRQDEKSGAHILAQADMEWENLKRSSTTGSKKISSFSRSPSSASTATRVSTSEKEKGKKSLEVPDSEATSAKRAFSLRNPKGREADRATAQTRPGLAHIMSVSSGHTVPSRMTEKKQHEKKPSFPPAGWSTSPTLPVQKDALRVPTSYGKAMDLGEPKKRPDDKSLPDPINKSLLSSAHAAPTRNTASTSPAIPSAPIPTRSTSSSSSIPQTRLGALNSSSSLKIPPSPPRDKGKQKATEDVSDPRLESLPSVPTGKLGSLSLGSEKGSKSESGRPPVSTVKEGVLVDI